ncbi:hypothetical protein Tco_1292368 [Tanacetum coccineum]
MSAATVVIVSAVCQANDHGFGGIRIPKQKRNTGTKEIEWSTQQHNLLNKHDKGEANSGLDSSIPFPCLGFYTWRENSNVWDEHRRVKEDVLRAFWFRLSYNGVVDSGLFTLLYGADKLQFSVTSSLRRSVRGGVESSQLALLQTYIEGTLLSNMEDRWVWDLNGEGKILHLFFELQIGYGYRQASMRW